MGQGGDALAEHAAVGSDVPGAHLEQIVEARRHHVALLDLGDLLDGPVEGVEGQERVSESFTCTKATWPSPMRSRSTMAA